MSEKRYKSVGDVYDRLIEECAEVIHIICKAQRFGEYNYHPNDEKKTPNLELLKREIGDLEQRIKETKKYVSRRLREYERTK